ncbi:hypothetical protein KJB58_10940 [Staphylococcus hyicus]|uniref:Staphylocoagulase N-terminal subdomain 1 domain-containing protein n=1 Tax=Staphylococcus hyicus TaxID=1284 RepID=A0A418JIS0_STAHY|nr:coagulase domain-containing protein [Staphylococcus hyicus]MCE5154975.1 hypothetical protein [Staphylococcus hyicus]RIO45628.1 hypothetical protein BUZ57_07090 [Staphylococcus hyicus]
MNKKLICLSLTALCATQLLTYKEANAIVTGEKNQYQSSSLNLKGKISDERYAKSYRDSLGELLHGLQAKKNIGYNEKEYENLYKEYTNKVLAEIEAVNKFNLEQKEINSLKKKNKKIPEGVFGLTYERYISVYNNLKENKVNFENKLKHVSEKHLDLKEFNSFQQYEANKRINTLENKILLIGQAFYDKYNFEVNTLYNKLDLIVGFEKEDRKLREPKNIRILNAMVEDLDHIINEFFTDINKVRPENIEPLTADENNNRKNINKLLNEVEKSKNYSTKKPSQIKEKEVNSIKVEGFKKKYDDEYEAMRKNAIEKINSKNKKLVANLDYDEEPKKKDKQRLKRKANQELQQVSGLSNSEKNINYTVEYEDKKQFNGDIVNKEYNTAEYSNGSVQYGPRPQFNSNIISKNNNITKYSNGSVQYGPRP